MVSYNPKIEGVVEQSRASRGDPEENIKNLIYYKMGEEFDKAMWGVDIIRGELIVIQADKKQRKSTLLANWVLPWANQLKQKDLWLCVDTLESGMPPETYSDLLSCITATRMMVGDHLGSRDRNTWPIVADIRADLENEMRLSPKFLRFGKRTELQQKYIDAGEYAVATLPITLWGPSLKQGQARELEKAMKRWDLLYKGEHPDAEGCEHRIFACDHVQQYSGFAGSGDYHSLEVVTSTHSDFLVTHPGAVVVDLSQVSLGSKRAYDSGASGEMVAKGGNKLAAEAVTVFQTKYDKDKHMHYMIVETPNSRNESPPTVKQEIDRFSGSFLKPAVPFYQR